MAPSMLLSSLTIYIMALLGMAFYTLLERKMLGYYQTRKGPNKVGIMGLPQPLADALKLFLKEQSKPKMANMSPFLAAPALALLLSMIMWSLYPMSSSNYFIMYGAMMFLCISSLNVYSTLAAGWVSNSKYALLGALRGIAQTISYEVSMALILLSSLMIIASFDLNLIMKNNYSWVLIMMAPLALVWFTTTLAETNRTPFDFAEGESELVSGFNTEYSSGSFALIFMAEYANIIIMSLLTVVFFSGNMLPMLMNEMMIPIKTMVVATAFIWVRASLPRMRYDRLMALTWKSFLPLAIFMLMLVIPLSLVLMAWL